MSIKHLAFAAIAALLVSFPGSSQTTSDLLQQGIHLQEATGDLDGAIRFFRQVVSSASSNNRALAGQAQYQIVLCMLQKGDRTAASHELAALEQNFGDMSSLVAAARKLIPGTSALLPAPWGDNESVQLNIKREGVATGEYLYYSADAWTTTQSASNLKQIRERQPHMPSLNALLLRWELKTKNSTRSISLKVDRDTEHISEPDPGYNTPIKPVLASDDEMGDPLAAPFVGPATDAEETVFLLRRLPLAVGYKSKVPVTSNAIAPVEMELTVTGIESVQTIAGKFNCYKVSFPAIGQNFWIGVEGARLPVKFQSAGVEAELVKRWGAGSPLDSIVPLARTAGYKFDDPLPEPGGIVSTRFYFGSNENIALTYSKRYTPSSDITQTLQRNVTDDQLQRGLAKEFGLYFAELSGRARNVKLRPGSIQTRLIGGQQAVSCLLDYTNVSNSNSPYEATVYAIWIATEDGIVEFWSDMGRFRLGTFRWQFDPILTAIQTLSYKP